MAIVNDSFDNLDNWTEVSTGGASIVSGQLQQERVNSFGSSILTNDLMLPSGDFDISIDWDIDSYWAGSQWYCRLTTVTNSDFASIGVKYSTTDASLVYLTSNYSNSANRYTVPTSATSGKLRLVRVGYDVTGYYDEGSGWVAIDYPWTQASSIDGQDSYLNITTSGYTGGTVRMLWDNLDVGSVSNEINVTLSAPLPWASPTEFYDVLLGSFTAAVIPDLRGTLRKYDIDVPLASVIPGITGLTEKFLTIAGTLAAVVPSLSGTAEQIGTISIPLAAVRPKLTGQTERLATLDAVLCSVIPDLSGLVHGFGTISVTLATVVPEIISLGTFHIICCNMAGGVTEYSNYNFNSFFEHDGKVYGVTNAGVYLLEGATDAGAAIAAYVTSGKGNMGVLTQKTVTDVFTHTNVNGNLSLNLKADDAATGQTYTLTGDGSLKNRRWKCALGVQGQEWQWQIANASGSDFEIRRLEFLADIASRR